MEINSAKSARQFVAAWHGHSGASRAYKMAAESQRQCAGLCGPNTMQAAGHLKAAAILSDESDRANH